MLYKLTTDRIRGCKVSNPYTPVLIRDTRGIMFYSTETMTPRIKTFNLPPGDYIHNGNFTLLDSPIPIKLIKLPKPERKFKPPTDFQIVFDRKPSKCTIYWDEKKIVFDNDFLNKPKPFLFYILYHEYGHSLYETEHYADIFAANLMKKHGYNTSQIGYAQLQSLSPTQRFRKQFLINNLIKCLA